MDEIESITWMRETWREAYPVYTERLHHMGHSVTWWLAYWDEHPETEPVIL